MTMVKRHKSKKQKSKTTKLAIFAVVVFVIAAIGYWQRNNIGALYIYLTHDGEEIQQKLTKTEEKIEEELNSLNEDSSDNSDKSGTDAIKHNSTADKNTSSENTAKIQALINEIYSMRSYYVAQLDSIHDTAMHSFWSLPEEQRTMDTKKQLALSFVDQATQLEKSCDRQMDDILSEIKALLEEEGKDTSVCSRIARAYAQEKQIKKAELISILEADPNR